MKITEVAHCLLLIAAGREINLQSLRQLAHYFSGTRSDLEADGFIELTKQVQANLRQQPGSKSLVEEFLPYLDPPGFSSDTQARGFIDRFVENLGPLLLWAQPVTMGYARRMQGSPFDLIADQTEGIPGWIILYTLEGEGVLDTGVRKLPLRAGHMAAFEPGAVFSYYRASQSDSWGHYWITFQAEAAWREWLAWPRVGPHIGHLALTGTAQTEIEQNLALLYQCFLSASPMKLELEHNLLEQLILRARNLLPSESQVGLDPRIAKAQTFIEDNYDRVFTLDEVAAAANISASRLAHKFKDQTGLTVLEWRDEKRMMTAAQLLRATSTPVSTIADHVGYVDAPYFSRTFKRLIGCTPRQYRSRRQ
ncbi:Arabinose operon regulatory protein [Halioglobus japonicus]|nr:Arabinose operon regulatory protein [Halioglobus japonicus]